MKETDYAYAVAYTRTLENKMLTKTDIEALINCATVQDALNILSDRDYGITSEYSKYNIDEMLKDEIIKAWNEVSFAAPKGNQLYIFLYQNDFHNLKTILKCMFSNTPWKPLVLYPCSVDPELIFKAFSVKNYSDLPEFLREVAGEAYELLARTRDGQLMEILLDKTQFKILRKAAKDSKSKFLINWVDLNATIINMKTALRAALSKQNGSFLKEALIPCDGINLLKLLDASVQGYSDVVSVIEQAGFVDAAQAATESLQEFEKWSDNYKIDQLKLVRNKAFGIEPIFAFLIGKRYEITCISLILSGIANGLKTELIRERLRDLYV